MRCCVLALLAMLVGCPTIAAAAPEQVTFPGPDGIELGGVLFRPSSAGPRPAVVALHGCGGLYGRSGALTGRHADWGERLAALGFVVLMPDSFGSRGLGPQCRTTDRSVRPRRERAADAAAAKAYLQTRPDVDPKAISLLGWSNGASTVLYAVTPREPEGAPDFVRAVAFYPGCRLPMRQGWRTRLPLLILIGEADDWTPAAPCEAMAADARSRGEAVEIVTYPGAFHDFDAPGRPIRVRRGLAYTANGEGVAHAGTDPAARADAISRVLSFLSR